MAGPSQKLSVANFTLKFGHMTMLDKFEQIVYPAFIGNHKRKYGEATYMLNDVELLEDLDGELYLSGRLIKNTTLTRDQVFRDGKLVDDRMALESAPSCFFVLQLSNHKLFFVKETSYAPLLATFESTIQNFLMSSYRTYIRQKYDEAKSKDSSITWESITTEHPRPELKITPMASEDSLNAHFAKFQVIRSVEVKLLETNHELDNSALFKDMRKVGDALGADDILVKSQKRGGEDGLNKANVARLIRPQAESGNAKIKLVGKAINGERLTTENENFNFIVPIKKLAKSVKTAAAEVIDKVKDQLSLGVLEFQKHPSAPLENIKEGVLKGSYERLR